MSGIGDGFSSWIQSLNNNVFIYAGRRCPSTWREITANVSNNAKNCAKRCVECAGSSLVQASIMGIIGLFARSAYKGEDSVEVAVTCMPSTTGLPVEENSCSTATVVTLAFGIRSAIVLMTMCGKIIYKKCKATDTKKPKSSSDKSERLVPFNLEEGLLLGASILGTGVLATSLAKPCGPVNEENKNVVMLSTVLYWTSAAASVLSNCVTSSIQETSNSLEDKVVELPMLTASEPELKASGTVSDDEGDKTITQVVVVMDSSEGASTSTLLE
ncbi:hypothetical protein CLAVI_000991 [Candidatus Clavichlamydia salmonicola]|uniref:hypothetical protein n=1 Tax=Candidatus Clavichlamydia salmonicola TaxID=469812 RepID=UPI001891CD79|nr:hypothetical protein [Candidatus Clavichlamydia salmonicola]MBF5051348.1 hypothetical protein [Candidatus Clavichlamydia salmonicola]